MRLIRLGFRLAFAACTLLFIATPTRDSKAFEPERRLQSYDSAATDSLAVILFGMDEDLHRSYALDNRGSNRHFVVYPIERKREYEFTYYEDAGFSIDWLSGTRVAWNDTDSATMVFFPRVDIEQLFTQPGGVMPTFVSGWYLSVITDDGAHSLPVHDLPVHESPFPDYHPGLGEFTEPLNAGVLSQPDDAYPLIWVRMWRSRLANCSGQDQVREGYWKWDGRNYRSIGTLEIIDESWQCRESTVNLGGMRSFEDIDADGDDEVLLRREIYPGSIGARASLKVRFSDPGEIVCDVLSDTIQPRWLRDRSGSLHRIRSHLPRLVIPQTADTSQQVLELVDQCRYHPLQGVYVDTMISDWWPSADGTSLVRWRLSKDSIHIRAGINNAAGKRINAPRVTTPAYGLALWIDTKLESDFGHSDCNADDILVWIVPDTADSVSTTTIYGITPRHGDFALTQKIQRRSQLTIGPRDYELTASLPIEDIGWESNANEIQVCGFAAEVHDLQRFPEDLWAESLSSYPLDMWRFDTRTWGNLLLAVRTGETNK